MKQNLVIFASGTPIDGGTGPENLVRKLPNANTIIVSNHEHGGVSRRAMTLRVPFYYFPGPYTADWYRELIGTICRESGMSESELWYALSGWFKKVHALSPARTFNIHPAPLPRFAGMYGENLHKTVWEAYERGEIAEGEILMHFVTEEYDKGPIFFRFPFSISGIRSYAAYRMSVRTLEHDFQPKITELVIRGEISWDGVHPESLKVPANYAHL